MSNKNILRCAVVGMGRISWSFHLPQICGNENFQLAAVVDPAPERLQEAKETFNPERLFSDFKEMLETVRPDLTVIASPTVFHREQSILALEHGSDVFCDKPVAMTLEDSVAMFEHARKLGRKLMVYQPHRVSGETLTVQKILASGKLGDIYQMERHISNYARRNDWQAFVENGGGMLFNYGAHFIDQLLYLAKDTTRRVKCELRRIISAGNADDVVNALITTGKGLSLVVDINQAVTCPLCSWRICGTRGTAVCEGGKWRMKYCLPEALPEISADRNFAAAGRRYPREAIDWIEEEVSAVNADPAEYYRHCYNYFGKGEAPFVSGEETIEVMRTIKLCRDDAGEY